MTPKILTASNIIDKFSQKEILQDLVKFENIEVRSIRDVIQDINGSVKIRMNKSKSFCYNQSSSIGYTFSGKHSIDSTIMINHAGVNFAPTVPWPLYTERTSRSPFPIESRILELITQEESFVIDKAYIRVDFEADYNLEKINRYFSSFSKEHTQCIYQSFITS